MNPKFRFAFSGRMKKMIPNSSNQIKSATDNNGMFSTENNDIQMMKGKRKVSINDSLSSEEKSIIRALLKAINRAGRSLIDTGEGLYLIDHTDKEGIINRKEGQEGFQCIIKIDTEGLRKQQINNIKDEYERTEKNPRGFDDWLKTNGYSNRLRSSDNIVTEVRRSNVDNAGLYSEAQQGKSSRGRSNTSSQENLGTGFIRVYNNDGTYGPRYIPIGTDNSIQAIQTSY